MILTFEMFDIPIKIIKSSIKEINCPNCEAHHENKKLNN